MLFLLTKKIDNLSYDFSSTIILGCRRAIAIEPSFSTEYIVKVVLGLYFYQNWSYMGVSIQNF